MGLGDKISNKSGEAKGKAKEAAGDLKHDGDLQEEGRADQASAKTKQVGEKAKDVWKGASD